MQIISGIYAITNLVDKKVYVGSSKNIRKRWNKHRNALLQNCHANSHLQAAWNQYGQHCFEFSVLEETLPNMDVLVVREQCWMDNFNCADSNYGYNQEVTARQHRAPQKINKINVLPEHVQPEAVIKYYTNNHSLSECAKFFEISYSSVHKIVKKSGLMRDYRQSTIVRCLMHPEVSKAIGLKNKGKLSGENHPNFGKPGFWAGKQIPKAVSEKGKETRLKKYNGEYFSEEGYKTIYETLLHTGTRS